MVAVTKLLYINRGLPGSGKSTRTRKMVEACNELALPSVVCSSDHYFTCTLTGQYAFNRDELHIAHLRCQELCLMSMMQDHPVIIIDNTNVTARECRPYVEMGLQYGYDIKFVEPTTNWAFDIERLVQMNTHRVPREALERMLARWVPNMTVEKVVGVTEGTPTLDEIAAHQAGEACRAKTLRPKVAPDCG